jgi:SAM-dependent methyltransferase
MSARQNIFAIVPEAIYDTYASVYDAIGQGRFAERMAIWSLRWLAERGSQPSRVLDLACGTGAATLAYAAAGCDVVGVDRSAAMLSIARSRARDAGYATTFMEGDIRDVRIENRALRNNRPASSSFSILPASFDVVTCFYDSLNYLLDDGDLGRVFAGAAAALRKGGYLIFDVNTAAEYQTWEERDTVVYDGRDYLVYNQLSYDPATQLGSGRIVWFVRETELWWRGEETHTQRAWSDSAILDALIRAELQPIACLSPFAIEAFPNNDRQTADQMRNAGRAIYVASNQV